MPKIKTDEDSQFLINHSYPKKRNKLFDAQSKNNPIPQDKNSGKWNLLQKKLYVQFLQQRALEIRDENYRKQHRIFKQMSRYIKSRTPDQCRSHHQKILKFHYNIDNILTVYKQKLQKIIPRGHDLVELKDAKNLQVGDGKNIQFKDGKSPQVIKKEEGTKSIDSENYFDVKVQNQKMKISISGDSIESY